MSRLVIWGWVLIVAGIAPAAAPNQPSPDPASLTIAPDQVAKARELVRRLGSDLYRDRDRAARELADMGRAALPALDAGRDDPDPEVRMRVVALLPRAEADELRARIDTFLADREAKYIHDLPGFNRFRVIAGDDRAARDLFAQALKNRSNYDLLLALRGIPTDRAIPLAACTGAVACSGVETPAQIELSLALAARRQELQLRMNPGFQAMGGMQAGGGIQVGRNRLGGYRSSEPELPDLALILLADSLLPESKTGFNPFQAQITTYLYQDEGRRAASGEGKHGPAFRRLVVHWMDTRDGVYGLQTAMNLAAQLRLGEKATAKYAARQLTLDGGQPWLRANAATMLARANGKQHLFTLTRLLSDETLLIRGGPNNPQPDIQIRDVALSMALLLTGQKPADYGLDSANSSEQMKYQYSNYRFQDDKKGKAEAKRTAALARWRNWELGLHATVAGVPAGTSIVAAEIGDKAGEKPAAK